MRCDGSSGLDARVGSGCGVEVVWQTILSRPLRPRRVEPLDCLAPHAAAQYRRARLDVGVEPLDHLQLKTKATMALRMLSGLELGRALRAVRQGCVSVLRAEVEKENFLRFRELSAAALLLACEVEFLEYHVDQR